MDFDDGRKLRRIMRPNFKRVYEEIREEGTDTPKRRAVDVIELTVIGDGRNTAVLPVETWLAKSRAMVNAGEIPQDWLDGYEAAYKRFVNGADPDEVLEDTPLESWPAIGIAQVEDFRSKGLRTVEDVALVPEGSRKFFGPGFIGTQNKAKEWVRGSGPLKRENDELRARIEKLEEMVKLLGL